MTGLVARIKQTKPQSRILAAILACAVLLSAAAAVLLPLWDEADAAKNAKALTGANDKAMDDFMMAKTSTSGSDAWLNYLNSVFHMQLENFQWTETTLSKWDGTTAATAPYSGGVWTVSTGSQLRYALANAKDGDIVRLEADLDMAGYLHNWERIVIDTSYTLDGNGHTIYNLGIFNSTASEDQLGGNSFIAQGDARKPFTVKNLTFTTVKMAVDGMSALFQSVGLWYENINFISYPTMKNVYVSDSLVYTGVPETMLGAGSGILLGGIKGATIEQCGIEGSTVYGGSHTATFAGISDETSFTNCYSVDCSVISGTYHSGGFVSCSNKDLICENCFTNNKVYGESMTGVFIGCMQDYSGSFKNCFAAGSIEGLDELGGFVGVSQSQKDNVPNIYENCYSTSVVGMRNGGSSLGGFVGTIRNAENYVPTEATRVNGNIFKNCFAAGEVGSIDTIVDGTHVSSGYNTVGGFVGEYNPSKTSGVTITNNYYDKQTTAMREWASGESQSVSGITGKLTTTSEKSGTGMTDPAFAAQLGEAYNSDAGDGYYPQLDVFSNATAADWGSEETANKAKAYSQASVSTVHLDTFDTDYNGNPLPETTYDTVRDLTSMFPLTSADNLSWQRAGVTGEPTLATGTGAKSAVKFGNMDMNVLHLYQADDIWYASQPMPGVDWLRVETNVGGQVGTRELRVCPTVGLDAGLSRYIGNNTVYDHADDVKLAYTTGARQAKDINDITYGVFPDDPLAQGQTELLNASAYANTSALVEKYKGQNNQFTDCLLYTSRCV